jgi:hypothetical protein
MLNLAAAIFRQLLSWPVMLTASLWLLLSYKLSFDKHLGAASLGAFLSYVVLAHSALILRFGYVLQQRRQQGWLRQDLIRNTTARAALAEFIAALVLLLLFSVCAQLLVFVFRPEIKVQEPAYYPVHSQLESDSGWTFDWNDNIPIGSKLCLTFDFSNAPTSLTESVISANDKNMDVTAGNILYWTLTKDDIVNRSIVLRSPAEHNLSLIRPLARLSIERPHISTLARLLTQQLLFFFTAIALCLFGFRYLKVNGTLAAVGSLSVVSLTSLQGVHLLPDVGGLIASGLRFERSAFTTPEIALLTWLMIGGALIGFSTKNPRPTKK